MSKRPAPIPLPLFRLHAAAAGPLHRQLYGQIRAAILNRALAGGTRLPSTRTLAQA